MNTERLIDQLAADLQPVHPASDANLAAVAWFGGCALLVMAPVVIELGVRPDFDLATGKLGFMFSGLVAAVLAIVAARAGLTWAIPGRSLGRGLRAALALLVGTLVLSFFAYLPASAEHLEEGLATSGLSCSTVVLAIAMLPAMALFFWLRRLAPMAPVRMGAAVGLAAGALGCLGVGMHCSSENTAHLLLYHGLPIAVATMLMGALGGRLLRW